MKIEAITKQTENSVCIAFDTGEFLYLHIEVLLKNSLRLKDEITEESYLDLIRQNKLFYIKTAAFNFLNRRLHSKKELYLKLLRKKYDKDLIDETLNMLAENGHIDDAKFAVLFAEEKIRNKSWGEKKISLELYKRGISRDIIESTVDFVFKEHNKNELAEKAALKKLKSIRPDEEPKKRKEKLFRYLASKGFDYDTIMEVVRKLVDDEGQYY